MVFNQEFKHINSDLLCLTLFLHPFCRKLAVHRRATGRTLEELKAKALALAKQLKWSKSVAITLNRNLDDYARGNAPFNCRPHRDALTYWKNLPISGEDCPLKSLAITLFNIVPHAADVERLFSNLGGIQGATRCRLAVPTFETLGRLRCHYTGVLNDLARQEGRPIRRQHGHMHTKSTPGINTDLVTTVSGGESHAIFDFISGDAEEESAMDEEDIEEQWEDIAEDVTAFIGDLIWSGNEIDAANEYDFEELDRIDQGIAPTKDSDDIIMVRDSNVGGDSWDIDSILASQ